MDIIDLSTNVLYLLQGPIRAWKTKLSLTPAFFLNKYSLSKKRGLPISKPLNNIKFGKNYFTATFLTLPSEVTTMFTPGCSDCKRTPERL